MIYAVPFHFILLPALFSSCVLAERIVINC